MKPTTRPGIKKKNWNKWNEEASKLVFSTRPWLNCKWTHEVNTPGQSRQCTRSYKNRNVHLACLQVSTQGRLPLHSSVRQAEAKTLRSSSRPLTRQTSPRRRSVRSLRSRPASPPSRRSRDCGPAVSLLPTGSRWGWGERHTSWSSSADRAKGHFTVLRERPRMASWHHAWLKDWRRFCFKTDFLRVQISSNSVTYFFFHLICRYYPENENILKLNYNINKYAGVLDDLCD